MTDDDVNVVYNEDTIKVVSEAITKATKHIKHPSVALWRLQLGLSLATRRFYRDC